MPYFKNIESGCIETRQYEINAEVLNGSIIPIDDNDECVVVLHDPNKSWSFNVTPLSKEKISTLFPKWELKLNKKPDSPISYMSIVLYKELEEYCNIHNYNLTQPVTTSKEISNIGKAITQIIPPTRPSEPVSATTSTATIIAKLVRDDEPITYRYKSPNQR